MARDLYLSESGDIKISPSGDIAVTQTQARDDAQQAYVRLLTEIGDYLVFPQLGSDLRRLYGMPQSPETGELGRQIIYSALEREGRFRSQDIQVKAVPTGETTIRFDVYIISVDREQPLLSVEQELGA